MKRLRWEELRPLPTKGVVTPATHGFTLMELLVVLVIIGIVTGIAVVAVSTAGPARLLQQEARRLAALVELQCDEATLRGTSYAISFGAGGTVYGFLRRAGQNWIPRRGDIYRMRELPRGARARLWVEGRPVILDEKSAGRPHLICLGSGATVPFKVRLQGMGSAKTWVVKGDWEGDVEIFRAPEPS